MCQFQELYRDENGYVIRCNGCSHYQILFNRTILSVTEADYQKFLQTTLHFLQAEVVTPLKEIVVPTPSPGIYMLLCKDQLIHFHYMMETADTEQNALTIVQLFHA